ncbi:eCIS core domain-containing protein [Aeromonas dhakensis]|uniref:eCIS core domain-containing protein n=1 Tax=Aeromonas dhakensis TaxID=196024 RepID=UPI003EC76803
MKRIKKAAYALAISLSVFFLAAQSVKAGGLFGDIIEGVCGNCGVGEALDEAHKQVKDAIPPYKAIEEGTSHVVNEALVQSTAPLLQEMIARSRDDALNAGVAPIPPDIRKNLQGFIPENILNIARYRVQGGGDLSLQVNAIRYGEANAITLDYVIVFKEQNDALYNPTLWAHELTHVQQYQDWGIGDFAIRYVRNYNQVEASAYEAGTRYVAWVSVKNSQDWASSNEIVSPSILNHPISPFPVNGISNMCGTAVTTCLVNGTAPVGTPCWCNTSLGAATGSLVPASVTPQPPQPPQPLPASFPSGYGMQVCGCWGPNPVQTAPEPRCASGGVRINICQGFCAPGHPLYAYVCI